jgi:glutamyl-tRNA synthetase
MSAIRGGRGRIVQWVQNDAVPCILRYPDGDDRQGLAERSVGRMALEGRLVQFERIGFFKLRFTDTVEANFAHR